MYFWSFRNRIGMRATKARQGYSTTFLMQCKKWRLLPRKMDGSLAWSRKLLLASWDSAPEEVRSSKEHHKGIKGYQKQRLFVPMVVCSVIVLLDFKWWDSISWFFSIWASEWKILEADPDAGSQESCLLHWPDLCFRGFPAIHQGGSSGCFAPCCGARRVIGKERWNSAKWSASWWNANKLKLQRRSPKDQDVFAVQAVLCERVPRKRRLVTLKLIQWMSKSWESIAYSTSTGMYRIVQILWIIPVLTAINSWVCLKIWYLDHHYSSYPLWNCHFDPCWRYTTFLDIQKAYTVRCITLCLIIIYICIYWFPWYTQLLYPHVIYPYIHISYYTHINFTKKNENPS